MATERLTAGMKSDTTPGVSPRSGGVRHRPEADIESIRELLHGGYGSSRMILKELIQNAEDAGASRMDVLFVPGDPTSTLRLLQGPALLVANDGAFEREHRDAISQISLGTKGTEDRAIGRFGKGLKSVFTWCEAFFVLARTDPRIESSSPYIADLFNPWTGWLNREWNEEFDKCGADLVTTAEQYLSPYQTGQRWLAFWFPLRRRSLATNPVSEDWIHPSFPGDESAFYGELCSDLRRLAPSLVTLRSLQFIRLADRSSAAGQTLSVKFEPTSVRIPAPNEGPGTIFVRGIVDVESSADDSTRLHYCGLAGRLADARVAKLKTADDWPKVVRRSSGYNETSCSAKGSPHFAALITSEDCATAESGTLEFRWCVFFPVGKQPSGNSRVNLARVRRQITINLHGFFFLDSERVRIDGLDDRFIHNGAGRGATCVDWNGVIASEGTLAHLPAAIAAFALQESLDEAQCQDLAQAIRGTSVWSAFAKEICQAETWRPRWKLGQQHWEIIPATTAVLRVPNTRQPLELLARIPGLARFSEVSALVVEDDTAGLPGLHFANPSRWTEKQVLQLLDGAAIEADHQLAAEWINRFMDQLLDQGALTSAIREHIAELPLLSVCHSRTGAATRISARQWQAAVKQHSLFSDDDWTTDWLRSLGAALPEWCCFVSAKLPRWFGSSAPACDIATAAGVVLQEAHLGGFIERFQLVGALVPHIGSHKIVVLAIRFLMHGNPAHAGDAEKLLFMPSSQTGQEIWSRLLSELLENDGGADSWRLLHDQWAQILSPLVQREANVRTIDAGGAWAELIRVGAAVCELEFPSNQWNDADVCALFEGLFQAGQTRQDETILLLRKLRLHTLRGRPNERVSVGSENGRLLDNFILNTPNFEADLPVTLMQLWQRFLSEAHVVENLPPDRLASTVQRGIFRQTDADGTAYSALLDWNYVVRHSLNAAIPCERAHLIMEALRRGDQSARGLGPKLKQTAWLPLASGASIAPDSVIQIDGLEEDLYRLLDAERDGLAGVRALEEWVTGHAGFATLRNYLPRVDQSLEMLGLWLSEKPDWRLGLTKQYTLAELTPILSQLEEFEMVPAAAFLLKFRSVRPRGYEEGIDPLIAEYLLPAVLQRFGVSQAERERLETILHRLAGGLDHSAFNAYLSQACSDGQIEAILPNLSLVNQRGNWIPARRLIWPSANLDANAQVCMEQADILAPVYRADKHLEKLFPGSEHSTETPLRGSQSKKEPDFEAEVEKLRAYLQPFRTGNIGEAIPAALVAVVGGHPMVKSLLEELLQASIGSEPENFIAFLLGDQADNLASSMCSTRFVFDIIRGESTPARTITGDEVTVEFTKDISTLIVGDPRDLWRSYLTPEWHLLRLRWIEDPDQLEDVIAIFAATIATIILKVHCNGVASSCPANLPERLSEIAKAGQTDLKRSQSYLLDMAEARLKELGVKDVPQLNSVLQKFSAARQARVDAELLSKHAPLKSRQRVADADQYVSLAKHELVELLVADSENATQWRLVEAVRRKMTDYQYSLDSLACELFQNADDAVAELEEMQNSSEPQARRFVLRLDSEQRELEIVHWGRPINRHQYPGFEEGLRRGYDQDLQKMLTLNFSDKGIVTGSAPGFVTGRFGLGFKSVFFLAQRPEIVSGRLAFSIRGGFYPVALTQSAAEDLRASASVLSSSRLAPTTIRLKWAQLLQRDEVTDAFDSFERVAPLLPIFSRRIRTVSVIRDQTTASWSNTETKLTDSGRFSYVQVGNRRFFAFRCALYSDERPATVLFHLDAAGISPLPAGWTGLWITTPTAERSDVSFALNAPFKPDAGRQRLALSNPQNRSIAEEVSLLWGEALIELFDHLAVDWARFSAVLNLHAESTPQRWWKQLWHETTRSKAVTSWPSIQNGGQTLSWIAWGQPGGAMRTLVEKRAAIPTELPGEYGTNISLHEVQFSVAGLLAELKNGCFSQVSDWPSTRISFPPGLTVHSSVAAYLADAECPIAVEDATLDRVISAALSPESHADCAAAERIGALFTQCRSLFETGSLYSLEVQRVLNSLKEVKLLAGDTKYHTAGELVCARALTSVIEDDEALRAAFAPPSAVLAAEYSDNALVFFTKTRGQLTAGSPVLAGWAREADAYQLPAVFAYLIRGELGQRVADELKRPWLELKRETSAWRKLSQEEQNEIERKFLKGYHWHLPPVIDSPVVLAEAITPVMNAEVAFRLVSDWWQQEQTSLIADYEARTYPTGFPGSLPWPDEAGWEEDQDAKTRWLLVFIHAALVPLGFNIIGRDQRFSQFLVSHRWLQVLTDTSVKEETLVDALDDYLGSGVQNTEYHFQMRQFIAFYAVAKNLESVLLSLRESDRLGALSNLHIALSPRANPALTGTGIDAPPLTGMLGIGSCHLLRELYRLRRLSSPSGHRFSFTPIRKVRRLCYQLFGIEEGPSSIESSARIYTTLKQLGDDLGRDSSFNLCFDLPLQYLAQSRKLRTEVLELDFDLQMDEDMDAAPQAPDTI